MPDDATEMECADPFHQGDSEGIAYTVPLGSGSLEGYECPTCGFQTVRVYSYVPTPLACPQCGEMHEGDPENPAAFCDTCVGKNMDAWIAEMKANPPGMG